MTTAAVATQGRAVSRVDFGSLGHIQAEEYEGITERLLYYYLLRVDENAGILPVAFEYANARLDRAEQCAGDLPEALQLLNYAEFEEKLALAREWWIDKQSEVARSLGEVTRVQCAYLLEQYAPTALLDGCWLQNFSAAATSHTELAVGMLKLYANEIGDGDPSQHHGNAYRDLKHGLGVYLPEVGSFAFSEQSTLSDASFSHPAFLLAISQFPRSLAPEILGVNLFYYVCGICPLYLALRDRIKEHGATTRFLDLHVLKGPIEGLAELALSLVRHNMESVLARGDGEALLEWRRVRRGFLAACAGSLLALDQGLLYLNSPAKSPREKMLELLERKSRHAHGYHADVVLEGKTLDQWLDPGELDAEAFLDVFARSRFVSPGNAGRSLLFRKVVAFRGPMFRMFSPGELQVIAEWIDSLPQDKGSQPDARRSSLLEVAERPLSESATGKPKRAAAQVEYERSSIKRYSQIPLCDLYYYVINIEYFPDVRPYAKRFAARWLRLAGRGLNRGRRPIPFEPYEHRELDGWLEAQHRRQVESYHRNKGEPAQSREEVIESTVQQAPMILIDGSWIQNSFNASASHTRVGNTLFHIYYDEVGNGDVALNHPNVFRELLAEMGVELPEFATLEFSRWPGFRPEAFQVPVFWLCISQFPKRFLPETLGLNLAMELSGVGGAYRDAIDALRYYGFDPCFIELHNSIDNVSTGHTACAIDAIKCHMDEMCDRGGAGLVLEHWHRVWTGYRALVPPPGLKSWFAGIF